MDERNGTSNQSQVKENEVGIDSADDSSEWEEKEKELFAEEPAGTESNRKRDDIPKDSEKIKAAKVKIKPLCETQCHTAFKDFKTFTNPFFFA